MIVTDNPIISNLETLFQPGDTVELRCVGNQAINGFYRDLNKLAHDAATLNTDFSPQENVYVCLNPILPDLYARRSEQFGRAERGGAVKDNQVVCRRWLLVDIDPVRPSGVSATNEQKRAAEAVAQQVYAWLSDQLGNHCLVCADSGNGSHILIRLDELPVDTQSRWICERFLSTLSDRFSTEQAKVDETTYNAARITCCYGTMKRKGSDLPEQPHRRSNLVLTPDPLTPADWNTLAGLVDPFPGKQQPQPPANGQAISDIPLLLKQHDVAYEQDDQYQTQSGELATRYVLNPCPFNPEHTDRSAAIIQWPDNGAIAFKCHHDGCVGKDWPALQQLWQLPASGEICAADIIFPSRQLSPVSSHSSHNSLETYISIPVLDESAFYGPIGQIVSGIEQHTEASPAAVLCSTLAYFGNALGRRYFAQLDQQHFPKLYVALVGATGSGRKGTADSQARRIVDAINPAFAVLRHSGLTTGEGLLQVLDDNREGIYPQPAVFTEREFAAVLKRADRQGNTLNTFIRDAWDNEVLANSTKKDPLRIEDHHVSILAHVTPAELKRLLSNADVANGFSNRFLWVYCRRSGLRPGAQGFHELDFKSEIAHLQDVVKGLIESHAGGDRTPILVPFNVQAEQLWREQLYRELDIDSEEDTLLTLMCSRQAQQVCRLALIFALADGAMKVRIQHLKAARAITDYVWESVDYVLSRQWWGDAGNVQDPAGMVSKLMQRLESSGPMTRTDISVEVFHRHRTAKEINSLRDLLIRKNGLRVEKRGKTEVWHPLV